MSSATIATPPIFRPGDRVRIPLKWPEKDGPCHIRTPAYVRGHTGTIVRHFGAFANPEQLAFGKPADKKNLYHVAFKLDELWGSEHGQNASLLIEIYEHWIERVES